MCRLFLLQMQLPLLPFSSVRLCSQSNSTLSFCPKAKFRLSLGARPEDMVMGPTLADGPPMTDEDGVVWTKFRETPVMSVNIVLLHAGSP